MSPSCPHAPDAKGEVPIQNLALALQGVECPELPDFEQDKGEEMKHGAGLVPEHAKCRDLEQIPAEPVNQRAI